MDDEKDNSRAEANAIKERIDVVLIWSNDQRSGAWLRSNSGRAIVLFPFNGDPLSHAR
jgi:hypothetical protein